MHHAGPRPTAEKPRAEGFTIHDTWPPPDGLCPERIAGSQTTAPVDSVTLRDALADAKNKQTIVFDETLDGGTIELSIVGEEHSILKGEVMGIASQSTLNVRLQAQDQLGTPRPADLLGDIGAIEVP